MLDRSFLIFPNMNQEAPILFLCDVYQLPSPALYLLQPDQNFLMKVKVEDLEGLLTQKHGVIVMKVKVEDLEGLGGQSRAGQRTGL